MYCIQQVNKQSKAYSKYTTCHDAVHSLLYDWSRKSATHRTSGLWTLAINNRIQSIITARLRHGWCGRCNKDLHQPWY